MLPSSPDVKAVRRRTSAGPVYLIMGLLGIFAVIFLVEFLSLSTGSGGTLEEALTADTYLDEVVPLLADADPARGPELLQKHGCNACHAGQNAGHLAPAHADLGAAAAERRPPLTAAAYVYESILYPGVFIVEGFDEVVMPRIYEQQVPRDELGDIIAYLLSPEAQ